MRVYDCIRSVGHPPEARRYELPSRTLPARADLRPGCPPVWDQGDLGACTGNALAALVMFLQMFLRKPAFSPSRLFIYYQERAIEGDVDRDAGASISDGMLSLMSDGVCDESTWPYDVARFAAKPPRAAYDQARAHKLSQHSWLDNTRPDQVKSVLAHGFPIVFGFTVYRSFESPEVAATGIVPMPQHGEPTLGGHAVLAVGYDDNFAFPAGWGVSPGGYIVRNSWGPGWGRAGHFIIPYAYLTNPVLASDFWTARRVG